MTNKTKKQILFFGLALGFLFAAGGGLYHYRQKDLLEKSIEVQTQASQRALKALAEANQERIHSLQNLSFLQTDEKLQNALKQLADIDPSVPTQYATWENRLNEVSNRVAGIMATKISNAKKISGTAQLQEQLKTIEQLEQKFETQRLNYEKEVFRLNPLIEQYGQLAWPYKKKLSRLPSSELYQSALSRQAQMTR